jgi:hypothetical protein
MIFLSSFSLRPPSTGELVAGSYPAPDTVAQQNRECRVLPADNDADWHTHDAAHPADYPWWQNSFRSAGVGYHPANYNALIPDPAMLPFSTSFNLVRTATANLSGIQLSANPEHWTRTWYGFQAVSFTALPASIALTRPALDDYLHPPTGVGAYLNTSWVPGVVTGNRVRLPLGFGTSEPPFPHLTLGVKIYRGIWVLLGLDENDNPIVERSGFELVDTTRQTVWFDQDLPLNANISYRLVGYNENGDADEAHWNYVDITTGATPTPTPTWPARSPDWAARRANYNNPWQAHQGGDLYSATFGEINATINNNAWTGHFQLRINIFTHPHFPISIELWAVLTADVWQIIVPIFTNATLSSGRYFKKDNGQTEFIAYQLGNGYDIPHYDGVPGKLGTIEFVPTKTGLASKAGVFLLPSADGNFPIGVTP